MFFFFFKQKTAYEMRISDWSSDVFSSDLDDRAALDRFEEEGVGLAFGELQERRHRRLEIGDQRRVDDLGAACGVSRLEGGEVRRALHGCGLRSSPGFLARGAG